MPNFLPAGRNRIIDVHLESGTSGKKVSHLEKELELNGLEAPKELQINTVTQQATKSNPEKSKTTCHHCKKQGRYWTHCRQLKREKDQAQNNTYSAGNSGGQINSNSNNKILNNTNTDNANDRNDRKPRTVYPP